MVASPVVANVRARARACPCACMRPLQNSTVLWETLPSHVMDEALRIHHEIIRGLMPEHNAYESATEG